MNAHYIVTTYVLVDDWLKAMNYRDDGRATISASEVLTIAVLAAKFFQNHHERTLSILILSKDIHRISVSRFGLDPIWWLFRTLCANFGEMVMQG
jgi:hypothetical protein